MLMDAFLWLVDAKEMIWG